MGQHHQPEHLQNAFEQHQEQHFHLEVKEGDGEDVGDVEGVLQGYAEHQGREGQNGGAVLKPQLTFDGPSG